MSRNSDGRHSHAMSKWPLERLRVLRWPKLFRTAHVPSVSIRCEHGDNSYLLDVGKPRAPFACEGWLALSSPMNRLSGERQDLPHLDTAGRHLGEACRVLASRLRCGCRTKLQARDDINDNPSLEGFHVDAIQMTASTPLHPPCMPSSVALPSLKPLLRNTTPELPTARPGSNQQAPVQSSNSKVIALSST